MKIEDYMLNKFGTSTCCTKNQTMDYHKLPRTNIARKNLSNTLKAGIILRKFYYCTKRKKRYPVKFNFVSEKALTALDE